MSGLFGGSKPQVVQPTPPAPIPDNNAPAVLEAQRKAAAEASARAGRVSTIITDAAGPQANARNTDSYANKTLGGGG